MVGLVLRYAGGEVTAFQFQRGSVHRS
jgi:hypothetical protein